MILNPTKQNYVFRQDYTNGTYKVSVSVDGTEVSINCNICTSAPSEYYFEKIKILNEENSNPMVIKDLKFYLADPWNPTALGEFRRVWLTTPVCESSLLETVVNENFPKKVIEDRNTIIYWKSQGGGKSIETARQTCKSKGLVIKYES